MKEGETLAQLLEERLPYYERYADVTVRESGVTEETVAAIAEAVRQAAAESGINL